MVMVGVNVFSVNVGVTNAMMYLRATTVYERLEKAFPTMKQ
jgi:hypothetical protein